MSKFRNGLVFAMEDADVEQASGGGIVAAELEIEQGVSQISQDAVDADELSQAVTDAGADADTLDQIQQVMSDSVAQGEGLSEDAAAIAQVAVEAICKRLGMSSQNVMPSMESFGSKNSRVSATRFSMESITDKLKTIWEAIRKAFATMWQKIKDFFAKFFSNTEKVKKLAKDLKNELTEKKSYKQVETQIDIGASAKSLQKDGKFTVDTAIDVIANHIGLTINVNKSFDIIKGGVEAVNGLVTGKDTSENLKKALGELAKTGIQGIAHSASEEGDVETTKFGPFVDNNFITFSVNTVDLDINVGFTADTKSVDNSKIDAPKAENVVKVCDVVIQLMDETEAFKKNQSKIDGLKKSFIAVVDAAIKFADTLSDSTEENSELKKKINLARKVSTSLNAMTARYTMMVPSMNVRVGKAALSFVSATGKNLKKEEPAKK